MPDNNSNPQTDGKKDSITISKKEAVLIAVIMSLIVCAAVISLIALSIKVNHSPQGSTTVQNGTYYSTSAISTTSGSMNSSSDETSLPAAGITDESVLKTTVTSTKKASTASAKGDNDYSVSTNGALKVTGTHLCNKDGRQIVLRGISSAGIMWFPQFATESFMKTLRDEWGASVFRIAMYSYEGDDSYIKNPDKNKKKVCELVDAAVDLDMYVIVDWHVLGDCNPQTYEAQAEEFFTYISKKYAGVPNIIYEICNEPNGNVTWSSNIKPYAEDIIPLIRKNSPDSVIIVGTSTWSQDVDIAAADPLDFDNVMYTLHFYAGTHKEDLRNKAKKAIKSGLPLFVTEWGTTDASGNGSVDTDSSDTWISFLEENGISWVNWSLCDKDESSAILKNGAPTDGTMADTWLSKSGAYVKAKMLEMTGLDTTTDTVPATPTPTVTAALSSKITSDNTVNNISLYEFNGSRDDSINTLNPSFKLVNNGTSSVKLSSITICYYFTPEDCDKFNFWCDYADINGSSGYTALTDSVTGKFVTGTSTYCSVTFTGKAGSIAPGDTVTVQTRITNDDWSNFDQTNDPSFLPDADDYTLRNACKLIVK